MKSGYNIQSFCDLESDIYDFNDQYHKQRNKWVSIYGKERQIFYKENENIDQRRFIGEDIKDIHDLLKCDCNIINKHLIQYYTFNVGKCISIII